MVKLWKICLEIKILLWLASDLPKKPVISRISEFQPSLHIHYPWPKSLSMCYLSFPPNLSSCDLGVFTATCFMTSPYVTLSTLQVSLSEYSNPYKSWGLGLLSSVIHLKPRSQHLRNQMGRSSELTFIIICIL